MVEILSRNCGFDCWECPSMDECQDTTINIVKIIPYELRSLGNRLDILNILRKTDTKLDQLLELQFKKQLHDLRKRVDYLAGMKQLTETVDSLLQIRKRQSRIKDLFQKIKDILK